MEQNSERPQFGQHPHESERATLYIKVSSDDQISDNAEQRSRIRERALAGQMRYRRDYEAGRVGNSVHSRSGRDLSPHRPKKIIDLEAVIALRRQSLPLREIARRLGRGLGTVARTLRECPATQ